MGLHPLTQQTKGDDQARYAAKWRLAKLLYERDWAKQRIIDLFAVIDWLLRLPLELERRLWSSINELERNANMPYTLSIERIARNDGIQQGIQQGIQLGIQQGTPKGEAALLRRLLTRRFGPLPPVVETRILQADTEHLEAWGERIFDVKSLDELFAAPCQSKS